MVAGIAFLLRTLSLDTQSLWRDEIDAIRFSSWTMTELLAGLFQVGHNGPLFFLLLRPWRHLTGNSEFALRYPSALMGAAAIPLGFILARQLGYSRRVGLLLSLLLATSPYLVWYGQEAKMYTLLLVLVMLAFIAYLKALTTETKPSPSTRRISRQGIWWVTFVLATTLAFYTHILAPLMVLVYGAVALLHGSHLRRHWRGWLISMGYLTIPYLPLASWQLPLLLQGFQSGHPFYPLQEEIRILLQLYMSGVLRFLDPIAFNLFRFVFLFLFLAGLFLKNSHRPAGSHIARWLTLAIWALLPPLTVYLISLRVPVFEDRYLIYITAAFYLLVAIGITLVRRYSPWLASLCLGLILTVNLMGIWQQQYHPIKADFRAAAAYLAGQPTPPSPIMVHMPYLQHTLNYYYHQEYVLLEGLWTNGAKTEILVDLEMKALTADLTELWLVVSEEAAWDNRSLIRAWLDKHATLASRTSFTRVEVYHYQFDRDSRVNSGALN